MFLHQFDLGGIKTSYTHAVSALYWQVSCHYPIMAHHKSEFPSTAGLSSAFPPLSSGAMSSWRVAACAILDVESAGSP